MSLADKQTRILVVDDFEMGRQILKMALRDLGYDALDDAEDGNKAVEAMKQAAEEGRPFGAIFCDWNMPEMNGLQVLRLVRQDSVYAKVAFVMVTAESDQESIVMALSSGASEYIVKPVNIEVLKTKIDRLALVGKTSVARSA